MEDPWHMSIQTHTETEPMTMWKGLTGLNFKDDDGDARYLAPTLNFWLFFKTKNSI